MCPLFGPFFFVTTSFAAVREAFGHVHPDKEVKKVGQNSD
jgi:hypothetical protein